MKCILKYPGAKNRIANWICEYIPSHDVYLEPYFGSGAVFFNKVPARIETLNDLDGNVVNYFKVVRERPNELAVQLEMTPYSRDEYYRACEYDPENSDIEKARKFAVRCWMGYGASNYYVSGFRSSQQSKSPYTTKEWRNLPERLLAPGYFSIHFMIHSFSNNDIVDVRQTGTPGRMVLHYLSIGTSAAGLTGCAYTRAMPAIFTQSRSCESGTGMRCCVISYD
jgi:hypothetical protein